MSPQLVTHAHAHTHAHVHTNTHTHKHIKVPINYCTHQARPLRIADTLLETEMSSGYFAGKLSVTGSCLTKKNVSPAQFVELRCLLSFSSLVFSHNQRCILVRNSQNSQRTPSTCCTKCCKILCTYIQTSPVRQITNNSDVARKHVLHFMQRHQRFLLLAMNRNTIYFFCLP